MTITLTREEAQQVLDALELGCEDAEGNKVDLVTPAIELLRARLAQPEPEPVAWLDSEGFPWSKEGVECRTTKDTYEPLYAAPPQREWQGLTDEERTYLAWESNNGPHCVAMTEAKLKEKNG